MSDLEIELWRDVSLEDIQDYKDWDRRVNGSIDDQMDDNS